MRFRIITLMLLLWLVAACVPQEPTDTAPVDNNPPIDPEPTFDPAATDDPESDEFSPIVIVTRAVPTATPITSGLPMPQNPATLVASETEDPGAGMGFDEIRLIRSTMAEDSQSDMLVLYADGRYSFNDQQGTTSGDVLNAIDAALDRVNFFGMQGAMLGPPGDENAYRYRLTVNRDGQQRSINSQDGYMPQAYIDLLVTILNATYFEAPLAPRATRTPIPAVSNTQTP